MVMRVDGGRGPRIGVILPGFSADQDDWCIPALRNLVRELAGSHEVEVFALRYPHHRESYELEGVVVHALGGGLTGGLGRARLFARAHARIAAAHRERRFDLLHAFWADEPGSVAVTAGRSFHLPTVVSLMGGELAALPGIGYGGQLSRVSRVLTRHALKRAGRVTVGSEYLRRICEARAGVRSPLPLPLGVDTTLFQPDPTGAPGPLKRGAVNLLNVGSLIPVKGHGTLLHAVALAAAASAVELHLHLVGAGPLLGHLQALASSLGLADRITFHGAVRHEDLPAYYRAADLHVQSSLHESQSLVVLESAACGTATIGTAVGVLPELGSATRTVAVEDPRALADVLLSVLHTPGQAAAMGRIAREIVAENYHIQQTGRRLAAVYAGLAGGTERARTGG